jgi:hypothetical protein
MISVPLGAALLLLLAGCVASAAPHATSAASPGGSGGNTPVLTGATVYGSAPAVAGALMHRAGSAATAVIANSGGAPISCSVTAGDPSGNFGCVVILGAVEIEYTSTGATNLNGSSNLVTQILTVTASNSAGTSAPVSVPVNVYADGALQASAGPAQYPTRLSGYARRPPWLVAGIDYAVGVSPTTTLQAPLTIAVPGGCSRNSEKHQFACTSGSPTFTGVDFSLDGGWQVYCTDSIQLTVTQSNFKIGANGNAMLQSYGSCLVTVAYSNFDANNSNDNGNGADTNFNGEPGGTIVYCWFKNAYGDINDYGGNGPSVVTIKYNALGNAGQGAGTHPDWLQLGGGQYSGVVDWNYYFQTSNGDGGGTLGLSWGGFDTGWLLHLTIDNSYNTFITNGGHVNYATSFYNIENNQARSTVSNNYVDRTGGPFQASGCVGICAGGIGSVMFTNNIDMNSGEVIRP